MDFYKINISVIFMDVMEFILRVIIFRFYAQKELYTFRETSKTINTP